MPEAAEVSALDFGARPGTITLSFLSASALVADVSPTAQACHAPVEYHIILAQRMPVTDGRRDDRAQAAIERRSRLNPAVGWMLERQSAASFSSETDSGAPLFAARRRPSISLLRT